MELSILSREQQLASAHANDGTHPVSEDICRAQAALTAWEMIDEAAAIEVPAGTANPVLYVLNTLFDRLEAQGIKRPSEVKL